MLLMRTASRPSSRAAGKIAASQWAPFFPKYVLLLSADSIRGFFAVMAICTLASVLAIQAALKVDPAEAIGG
jgi:putative ABC transport system permease protein